MLVCKEGYTCVGVPEVNLRCHSSGVIYSVLEMGLSVAWALKLASELQLWDCKVTPPLPSLLWMDVLGTELKVFMFAQ